MNTSPSLSTPNDWHRPLTTLEPEDDAPPSTQRTGSSIPPPPSVPPEPLLLTVPVTIPPGDPRPLYELIDEARAARRDRMPSSAPPPALSAKDGAS